MIFFLTIPAFIWLILSALFFAAGEYLSKRWGMHPSVEFALVVVGTYALGTFAWLPALLHKNQLAIMGTAWLLLAMAATLIIGVFVFHEKLSHLQVVGIVLALVALILLRTYFKINDIIIMLTLAKIKKQKQTYGFNQSAVGAGISPLAYSGKTGWPGSSETG